MPVSRVVVRVEKAAGCPLARRRSPCRWRRNCRSCHREQSSKGPISSLRPQTRGAGKVRSWDQSQGSETPKCYQSLVLGSKARGRGSGAARTRVVQGDWRSRGPQRKLRCQAEGARGLRRGSGLPGRGVVGHDHLCQRRRWRKGWWRAFGGRSALFCDALPALGARSSDEEGSRRDPVDFYLPSHSPPVSPM